MDLAPIPEAENTQLEASVLHQDMKFCQDSMTPICKICLCATRPLRLPCHCKGSMAYVHEICLSKWINVKGGDTPSCELCKQPYSVVVQRVSVCSLRNMMRTPTCYYVPVILACGGLLMAVLILTSKDLDNSTNLGSFIGCLVALLILVGTLGKIFHTYKKRHTGPRWLVIGGSPEEELRKDESESLKINVEPMS